MFLARTYLYGLVNFKEEYMSKQILETLDAVANEKGISQEVIIKALEDALTIAIKKRQEQEIDIYVRIIRGKGDLQTFRRWLVVENEEAIEDIENQMPLKQAQTYQKNIAVGDFLEIAVPEASYGRITMQAVKQTLVQKLREIERSYIVENYKHWQGTLVTGIIKRIEKNNVYIGIGDEEEEVDALIPRDHVIPREPLRVGDRVRGYLKEVRAESKGPQLFVSRTAAEFLLELFKKEVPEVREGIIQLKGAARDPGLRAKIAVKSLDPRLDPVGACVGMRGARVQAVSNELAGEKIDIIVWDENPAQFVINAMAPAEVVSIGVDEDNNTMDIAVTEHNLSKAIGKSGQNVRLASELTGWILNVMTESEAKKKTLAENQVIIQMFKNKLMIEEVIAEALVEEGFSSIEEIAYVPAYELLQIGVLEENLVNDLRQRARDILLTQAIAEQENQENSDLLTLKSITEALATILIAHNINTIEILAEQAVADLIEIEGITEDIASELIMAARSSWFTDHE